MLVCECDLFDDELGKRIAKWQALLPLDKPIASIKAGKRRKLLDKLQRKIAKAMAS